MQIVERFWSKVKTPSFIGECWDWQAGKNVGGYGVFHPTHGSYILAHRFSYQGMVGPIGEGLELDHLCRNTSCVNPNHLQPVTHKVNLMRGVSVCADNSRKTHCPQGHPLEGENLVKGQLAIGRRSCRMCDKEAARRFREKWSKA